MGIHDRDYAREDDPNRIGPYAEPGSATRWLLGISVVVFFLQMLTLPDRYAAQPAPGLTEFLALNTSLFWEGQVWRVLTYGLAHSDIWHLLFNMLGLYFFGRAIEDRYGSREFVGIYLVCVLLGGLAFLATHWTHPGSVVGASAAILGVLVLYACNWPEQRVLLFFVIPVRIWVLAVIFVGIDALGLLRPDPRARVAVEAHLAGAAFAFFYFRNHWNVTGWLEGVQRWRKRRAGPHLRVYREEPEEPIVRLAASLSEEEQLEAKVDAVLEKLSRVGQEGLTAHDREILQRASEVFRKRRG